MQNQKYNVPTALEQMFKQQYTLYSRLLKERKNVTLDYVTVHDPLPYIKDNIFFLNEELHEMCRELPYMKFWKKYDMKDYKDRSYAALEEFIDAIHFAIDLGLLLCIDPSMYSIPKFEPVLRTNEERCNQIKECVMSIDELINGLYNIKKLDSGAGSNSIKMLHDVSYLIVNEFITIACCLQVSNMDVIECFDKKNKVNHERQDGGY